MLAFFALLVVLYICFYCLKALRRRLATLLFWNGLIRLFMEVYLEAVLLSVHNLKSIVWYDSSLHIASNILAIIFVLVFCLLPLFLLKCLYTFSASTNKSGIRKNSKISMEP